MTVLSMLSRNGAGLAALAATSLVFGGCALTPRGLRDEKAALAAAGAAIRPQVDPAELPAPAGGDDWRVLLRRALLANGDVHAAWYEWKAAVERVRGASAWPNSNVSLGYSYMFSDESVKSFDRSSFTAGFDAMENLAFPGKTMASGRVALADARAAGERFRAAKFKVQRELLEAWLDLAMAAETARLAIESTTLAGVGSDVADAALRAGGNQSAAFSAQITAARTDNDAASARADIAEARTRLATLTAIDDPDSIGTPTRLPTPRELPEDSAVLVEAAGGGPGVKGLEHDRHARKHEEALARLQWIPDINPYAAATGSIEQAVGAMIVLPTAIAEIQSGIAVAKAMRRAAASRLAQARHDKAAAVHAAWIAARDSERVRRLLEERVMPAARSAATTAETGYVTGTGDLAMLVQSRAMLIETRKEIAESAIEREKQLAQIEELLGADLETFTGDDAPGTRAKTRARIRTETTEKSS